MTKSFVISSGHGKFVSGAVGILTEVVEARRVVERIGELIEEIGDKAIVFHEDKAKTVNDNLKNIVIAHNKEKRDIDISVHFNAAYKTDLPMGVEVLYYSDSMRKEASVLSAAIAKASGLKDRGAKQRTNLYVLKNTNKPALLIEVCFVDSKKDTELYKKNFEAICLSIAEELTGKVMKKKEYLYRVFDKNGKQVGSFGVLKNAEALRSKEVDSTIKKVEK